MSKDTTGRGFRVFLKDRHDRNGNAIQVVESSIAFEGPHVRMYVGESACVHMDLPLARLVRDALSGFIAEAEAGELTEKPTEADKQLYQNDVVVYNLASMLAKARLEYGADKVSAAIRIGAALAQEEPR